MGILFPKYGYKLYHGKFVYIYDQGGNIETEESILFTIMRAITLNGWRAEYFSDDDIEDGDLPLARIGFKTVRYFSYTYRYAKNRHIKNFTFSTAGYNYKSCISGMLRDLTFDKLDVSKSPSNVAEVIRYIDNCKLLIVNKNTFRSMPIGGETMDFKEIWVTSDKAYEVVKKRYFYTPEIIKRRDRESIDAAFSKHKLLRREGNILVVV